MPDFFEFQVRPRVLYRQGLVDELGHEIAQRGARRVFIVSDAGLQRSGLLDRVVRGIGGSAEVVGIFCDVPANSSVAAVERAAAAARQAQADIVVGLGGGSPLDTAKAMRILLTEGGQLRDYEGYNVLERALTPMIAIPTTGGTGSEVTPFAVIRDEEQQLKLTFSSPYLSPEVAILDPETTRELPPPITSATGMDALTHAIESFLSRESNPISEPLALQAIDLIANNLRAATFTPEDQFARGQLLIGSCIAGMAFSSSMLGVVHAMAHAVGGVFPVHHGTVNAILLPHGMRFNSAVVPNRLVRVSRALGVNAGGRPEEHVIEDGIDAVRALAQDCGLPMRLRSLEIPEEALPALAETALVDAAIFSNPREASAGDILALLQAAW
ncbi:iron-containing alcohol dehydrogenase [Chloroflexia bacterium SDU3-3]|nr:iron-containing alcohol dehydrogenase [Chloroflexia bacterium SDU3-3]